MEGKSTGQHKVDKKGHLGYNNTAADAIYIKYTQWLAAKEVGFLLFLLLI